MYELAVKRRFSAAHQLRGYKGKCESLHGHTYLIEVFVRSEELDRTGLAVDFKELKKVIDGELSRYDHAFLNELPPFDKDNPSAENMARVIYGGIKKGLPEAVFLSRVLVWESEDAGAAYFEE
ncbi:MAG: 6-carboxytetrahydropterin synthase QueD [bacterium]